MYELQAGSDLWICYASLCGLGIVVFVTQQQKDCIIITNLTAAIKTESNIFLFVWRHEAINPKDAQGMLNNGFRFLLTLYLKILVIFYCASIKSGDLQEAD